MRFSLPLMCVVVAGLVGAVIPPQPPTSAPAGWKLTWSDEFDGNAIDRTKWDFDTGTGFYIPAANGKPGQWVNGWGNNELQYYTDRAANAYVADGCLHIKAVKEDYHGSHYTSAKLRTGGPGETPLLAQCYGRFEFRAKLPAGQGYWPALWMLPQDAAYGGWAASGEIDVMENRGKHPDIVQGTIHFGDHSPKNVWHGKECRLPDNGSDFHVYALEWDPGRISWSVDGVVYQTRDDWHSESDGKQNPWPAPFDKPFYLIMNLAVGGQFGGNPDAQTTFPKEMLVDYVRVYQRTEPIEKVLPRGEVGQGSVVEKVK